MRQHATYSIAILPHFKKAEFREKLRVMDQVKEMTVKRMDAVDRGIAELTQTIEELVKFCRDSVEMLREKKDQMAAALEEVENTLTEEQPELNRPYSKVIRSCVDGKSAELWLFDYKINPIKPESLINVASQIEMVEFPHIYGNVLNMYGLSSKKTSTFALSTSFTVGTVFCLLTNSTVLCVGGTPSSASVYQLDLSSKQLATLTPTNTPRGYPGIAKVGDCVYVFGSYSPNLATCEKLSLATKVWTNLRDMNAARNCFTPGVYLEEIFIVGPYQGNRSIEVFNKKNETFRSLSFQLPAAISAYTTAFVVAGELYVLGGNSMGRRKLNSIVEMQVSTITGGSAPLSNCPAFLAGKEVLLVNYNGGQLFKVNYETKAVVA